VFLAETSLVKAAPSMHLQYTVRRFVLMQLVISGICMACLLLLPLVLPLLLLQVLLVVVPLALPPSSALCLTQGTHAGQHPRAVIFV
jgi:hypothetical protein